MIVTILAFVASKLGRYVVGAVGVLALLVAFKSSEQRKGAAKLATKIETANATVAKKADAAARKSVDPATSGLRLPYYRAD